MTDFKLSKIWPSGMRRRWWMFRVLDLAVKIWPVFKKPQGLLVVRMDGIGDMVLFRRTLDHYAEVFGVKTQDITVLGCSSWGGIALEFFQDYNLRIIDEHAFERQPFYRFIQALWVRKQAFAIAVSDIFFRKALTADSLVWFADAPRTIVSAPYISDTTRSEFGYYIKQVDALIDTGDYPTHEIIRHFDFISQIAGKKIKPEIPAIAWRVNPPPVFEGRPYVVLNFGSNEPGRRWPFAKYTAIAQRLLDMGYRVAFTGGAGEDVVTPEIRQNLNRPGVINLVGRTSLGELMDLIKNAKAVISNDTGPAHLSLALGTPTVVIVGGGHFGSFVPYPSEITPPMGRFVYHRMDCYHCFWRCDKRSNKEEVFPCVDRVSEEQVWQELEPLLQ